MSFEVIAGLAMTLFIAVAGWVWNLASKIGTQDARLEAQEERIKASEALSAGASARAIEVGRDLSDYKEHVVAEYVNRDAMREVTEAINRLGDRLDKLFITLMSKPGQ
jgi:hypothetical protein